MIGLVQGFLLLCEFEGRDVAQGAVGPEVIVFPSPVFEDDPGLRQCPELLPIQAFITEPGIEALDVSVLPWASRVDIEGLDAVISKPLAKLLFDELGAVIAADVLRGSVFLDEPAHNLTHLAGIDFAIHMDAEAFPGVFIDDVEHTEFPATLGGAVDEVPAPHVVAMAG